MPLDPAARQSLNLLVVAHEDAELAALAAALDEADKACLFHRVASADSILAYRLRRAARRRLTMTIDAHGLRVGAALGLPLAEIGAHPPACRMGARQTGGAGRASGAAAHRHRRRRAPAAVRR